MRIQLYKRIFLNFVLVIALFGLLAAGVGAYLINRTTVNEAQRRVRLDLRSAWSVVQGELDGLELFLGALSGGKRVQEAFHQPADQANRVLLELARRQGRCDFLGLTDARGQVILRTLAPYATGDYLAQDPVVGRALKGETVSGFVLLEAGRLRAEGGDLEEKAFMVFEPTARAKLRAKEAESAGMALVAATPVEDETGARKGVLYAGILLNRNHALVDKINAIVFEEQLYEGRPAGTVTIFQWDSRIATNVKNASGNRATGTRVSETVYDSVLENNRSYYDRAFVVNDWYLSAYDPIHDLQGQVIGILYVGVLARQYDDFKHDLWKLYGLLSLGAVVIVLVLGFVFSRRLTGSISRLAQGAADIAGGRLDMQVAEPATDDEVRDLTRAFNFMAGRLKEREERLKATNAELDQTNRSLQVANRNYMDMLGFVSHELKNTLGVIYTSAKALGMAAIGPLTEAQAGLVANVVKSIEKAVGMTRKYLDLSRIEKGELKVNPRPMDMIADVVAPLLAEFGDAMAANRIELRNELPPSIPLTGDRDLLQVVYKNLLDNALKYGRSGGAIRLCFSDEGIRRRFEVWNQGENLSQVQLSQVFDKFVRLRRAEGLVQGTGLGLFITRDIVRKHGGDIHAECQGDSWIKFIFTLPSSAASA
ncbi:MAG: cache domain-containing protein [Desulfobacteraceae bacterium]|nr:cache domain-containing protein [Desulfobacteraceae bacterium]